MNPPKSREEELFFTALALPLAGRSAYLSSACGDDDTLRGRVELLLRAHEEARSFMETSPADGAAETPTGIIASRNGSASAAPAVRSRWSPWTA